MLANDRIGIIQALCGQQLVFFVTQNFCSIGFLKNLLGNSISCVSLFLFF
jgi:hypothetical protein